MIVDFTFTGESYTPPLKGAVLFDFVIGPEQIVVNGSVGVVLSGTVAHLVTYGVSGSISAEVFGTVVTHSGKKAFKWEPEVPLVGDGWKAEHWWDDSIVLVSKLYPLDDMFDGRSVVKEFLVSLELKVVEIPEDSDTYLQARGFGALLELKDTKPVLLDAVLYGKDFSVVMRETVVNDGSVSTLGVDKGFSVVMVQNAIKPEFTQTYTLSKDFVVVLEVE